MFPTSTKSCESLYSTTSSKGSATNLNRRKTPSMRDMAPNGNRQPAIIPAHTEVRQRVLSARRLRMKTLQNQLNEAQQTLAELAHENRILRTLHKRQDSALSKYESTNAELPKLLHSHAEELRVWQTKYRTLQGAFRDLEQKMKHKETVILSLSDENKYYSQLNKDKGLEDRQRLTDKIHAMEARLQEKDNDMKMMARKMQLETKNLKQQLQNEQKKTKEIILKLEKARLELSGYRKLDELNMLPEKYCNSPPVMVNRSKPNRKDEEKEKILEKEVEKVIAGIEETGFQQQQMVHTNRSIKSNATVSKGDLVSTRTMRKVNVAALARRSDQTDLGTVIDLKKPGHIQLQHIHQQKHAKNKKAIASGIGSSDVSDISDDISGGDHDNGSNLSNSAGEDDLEFDDEDDDDEQDLLVANPNPKTTTRLKEEISNIRKQISEDFKEREAFLDTFCRQANLTNTVREDPKSLRNSINLASSVPTNHKSKLLAALKAIDDKKGQN